MLSFGAAGEWKTASTFSRTLIKLVSMISLPGGLWAADTTSLFMPNAPKLFRALRCTMLTPARNPQALGGLLAFCFCG